MVSLPLPLSLPHTHTHRKPPPGLTWPPTQSPTGGSALFAEKACCVSVTSTHCSGVRVKPGTSRDKGPPSQGQSAQGVAYMGKNRPGTSPLAGVNSAQPCQGPQHLALCPPSPHLTSGRHLGSSMLPVATCTTTNRPQLSVQGPEQGDWGPKRKRDLSSHPPT